MAGLRAAVDARHHHGHRACAAARREELRRAGVAEGQVEQGGVVAPRPERLDGGAAARHRLHPGAEADGHRRHQAGQLGVLGDDQEAPA